MPHVWPVFGTGIILAVLLLFIPFFFEIDTEEKRFRLRWALFVLTYDFSRKTTFIEFAGIHFQKKRKIPPPSVSAPRKKAEEKPKKENWILLLSALFSHRSLAIRLVQKAVRYGIDLLQSISISELDLSFSLEDPIVNGVCYGAIQGIRIERVRLAVNFFGENRFVGRFRLSLYRIVVPTLLLLIRLPYFEMVRVAREIRRRSRVEKQDGLPDIGEART